MEARNNPDPLMGDYPTFSTDEEMEVERSPPPKLKRVPLVRPTTKSSWSAGPTNPSSSADPTRPSSSADPDQAKVVGRPDQAKIVGRPDKIQFVGSPDKGQSIGADQV